ncbi:hypothetical protein [Xenorhabdus sp. IM139775]|uniref:hypothetical protein n=1 Tax=Xenorhabdus sp. IM139775 TaxID=3025876 RepID=UPI0023597B6A|nr:hypothetical protein [Xenorhabdus sp. IM139775]MDC9592697.1 hypothetical protein [Xenorhabdus sp. IM139775]
MNSLTQHKSQSEKIIGLSHFTISLRSGHPQDHVFANGNMQVEVVVNIRASGADNKTVVLSDEQLNSIQLIDYDSGHKLSGEWSYSSVENNYAHTFPVIGLSQSTLDSSYKEQLDDTFLQRKFYWVTTTKIETIQIGAQISLDQTSYKTTDEGFGTSIIITGHAPITYYSADLKIEEQKDIDSGTYAVHPTDPNANNGQDLQFKWSQTNFYITPTKGHPVKDTEVWNVASGNDPGNVNFRRFTYLTNQDNLYLMFLWGTLKENRTAGVDTVNVISKGDDAGRNVGIVVLAAYPEVQINTTPRDDAISVSKLYFEAPCPAFWGQESYFSSTFNFHDIYGNQSGNIEIVVDEDNQSFHLKDV